MTHLIATDQSLDMDALVRRDAVHRRVYVDPSIFELELERVFERTWLYVGHESQVRNAGDYYATRLGRYPVLMVRGDDAKIRIFLNRCMHKGATLVAEGGGSIRGALRCAYHGWTYKLNGSLRVIPARDGYTAGKVCAGAPEYGLRTIGAVENYRGFIFGRISSAGPSLAEWLGPLASSLDNFVDRAPAGTVSVAGGVLRYEHACNWKFFTENTLDALHPMVVHLCAARAAKETAARHSDGTTLQPFELQALAPFAGSYAFYDDMGARVMSHGHADLGGRASIHSAYDEDPAYLEAMNTAYGETRAKQILSLSRNNSLAYPSLMFKAPMQLLRVVRPLAVDRTLIETWHFQLDGAPSSLLRRTLAYSTLVNSSAGMVGPDDHQLYRQLQAGLSAPGAEWVDMSRHLHADQPPADGSLDVPGTSDAMFRGQFAAWRNLMGAD